MCHFQPIVLQGLFKVIFFLWFQILVEMVCYVQCYFLRMFFFFSPWRWIGKEANIKLSQGQIFLWIQYMHDIKFCQDDMIMLVALCQLRLVPRISLQSFKHVKPNFKAISRGSSCDGMLLYVPKSTLLGNKKI